MVAHLACRDRQGFKLRHGSAGHLPRSIVQAGAYEGVASSFFSVVRFGPMSDPALAIPAELMGEVDNYAKERALSRRQAVHELIRLGLMADEQTAMAMRWRLRPTRVQR